MTTPPTNPDELPTGPLRPTHPVRWALLLVAILAVMGYYWFAQRAVGREIPANAPLAGSGISDPPTAPANDTPVVATPVPQP